MEGGGEMGAGGQEVGKPSREKVREEQGCRHQ